MAACRRGRLAAEVAAGPGLPLPVALALKARELWGCHAGARFGDCRETSLRLVRLLNEAGVRAKLAGGRFVDNPDDDLAVDHSWAAMPDGSVLDPTVDQFFSSLDVDLRTETPGVYWSSPEWDGPWLAGRYESG